MIEQWFIEHEEKLKIASLIVAFLVFFVAIYRWLLLKWRADVSLRKYAYLNSFESKNVAAKEWIRIDVPIAQDIRVEIREGEIISVLYEQMTVIGELKIALDMEKRAHGNYEIVMLTADQTSIKKITWSG